MKTFKQFLSEAKYKVVTSGKVHKELSAETLKFVDGLIAKFKFDPKKVGVENLNTSRYQKPEEDDQVVEIVYDEEDTDFVGLFKSKDGKYHFYLILNDKESDVHYSASSATSLLSKIKV